MLKNIPIRATTSAERYCNEEQKWWSQPASYSKLSPGGPIPHKMAKTFDGPPTLERSGSEHRVGRFPSSRLRFLSPGNGGTEGGVKTIEEDRDERWSLP